MKACGQDSPGVGTGENQEVNRKFSATLQSQNIKGSAKNEDKIIMTIS